MTGQRDIASARSVIVNNGGKSLYGDVVSINPRRHTVDVKLWGSAELTTVRLDEVEPVEMPPVKEFFEICNSQRGKKATTQHGAPPTFARRGP